MLVCTGGHSHWSWNVLYNPFHDQLVLSTGTDSMVNLWRVSSVSSAPLLTLNDDDDSGDDKSQTGGGVDNHYHQHHQSKDENKDNNNSNNNNSNSSKNRNLSESAAHNVLVGRMEHTADACYGAAWGAADAWIYVTVGYDGKVVLSHVPSKEKYKILL
jgi:EARP and GARP complex-interacting protein 1